MPINVLNLTRGNVVHAEGGVLRQIVDVDRDRTGIGVVQAIVLWRSYPSGEETETHVVPVGTEYELYTELR